jgi:hypothetical protein
VRFSGINLAITTADASTSRTSGIITRAFNLFLIVLAIRAATSTSRAKSPAGGTLELVALVLTLNRWGYQRRSYYALIH